MGRTNVNIQGYNSDIDAAEDLITAGGDYTFPTAARVHAIVSSSIADDVGSTGATAVLVEGLDTNLKYQSETVAMDGTTPVNTVNSYLSINKLTVSSAGSGKVNAGNITATAATDSTVSARIAAGDGQSSDAVYTVDSRYDLWVREVTASMGSVGAGSAADVEVFVRASRTGPWRVACRFGLNVDGSSSLVQATRIVIPGGSDIRVRVIPTSTNVVVLSTIFGDLVRRI